MRWTSTSNFLVVVSARDEQALLTIAALALSRGIVTQVVREPDLADEATAIALEPSEAARRLCSSLPLALRQPVPV